MRKDLRRRLDALEGQVSRDEEAAKKKAFLSRAPCVLLGYHVGGLKPHESPSEAYARALNFQGLEDFVEVQVPCIFEGADRSELQKRDRDAHRRLFAKFGLDFDTLQSMTAYEEAITEMAEELPDHWAKWIADAVDEVDPYEEKFLDELWSKLESGIASETRRESRKTGTRARNSRVFTQRLQSSKRAKEI